MGRELIGPLYALENAAEKDRDGKRSLQLGVAFGIPLPSRAREACDDVYLFLDPPGPVTYILLNEKKIWLPCLHLALNSCLSNFFIFLSSFYLLFFFSFSRRPKVIDDLFYSRRVVICRAPF